MPDLCAVLCDPSTGAFATAEEEGRVLLATPNTFFFQERTEGLTLRPPSKALCRVVFIVMIQDKILLAS